MPQPIMYWNEKLGKTQTQDLVFRWKITAAKTVQAAPLGAPTMALFDAVASQAVIDAFLGTSSEFTLAQFDATSMGADAFGAIINMQGQVAEAVAMEVVCYSGTDGGTSVRQGVNAGTLAASTLETAYAKGSSGNIALKVNFGNTPDFDALTSGLIVAKLSVVMK